MDNGTLVVHLLERELEVARRIQAGFLPAELPRFPGWEIAARFQPARQVAGDFYDAFPLVQNRRLGLVIGDVCDKGVTAAVFMGLFRTLIRAFAQQAQAARGMSVFTDPVGTSAVETGRPAVPVVGTSALKSAVEQTNDYIAITHGSTCMFAALFFAILDPSSGVLVYINAGHEPPILVGPGGVKERLATTGPVLGLFPGVHFDIQTAQLEPGDTLVAYTDGVTEAVNPGREFFEEERLCALLEQPAPSAAAMLERVHSAVSAFSAVAEPSDDITLLAVRRL